MMAVPEGRPEDYYVGFDYNKSDRRFVEDFLRVRQPEQVPDWEDAQRYMLKGLKQLAATNVDNETFRRNNPELFNLTNEPVFIEEKTMSDEEVIAATDQALTAEIQKRRAQILLDTKLSALDEYGSDTYANATVIRFRKQFRADGAQYLYAAIKADGAWYTTATPHASSTLQGRNSWEQLVLFLLKGKYPTRFAQLELMEPAPKVLRQGMAMQKPAYKVEAPNEAPGLQAYNELRAKQNLPQATAESNWSDDSPGLDSSA